MLLKKSGLGKARFAADARQFTSVATAGKTYTWRKYTPLLDKDRVLVRDRNGVKQSRSKFLFPSGIMICLDENGGEVAMFDNCWTQLNPRKEGELWIHPGVAEPLQHELLLSALVLVEIERRKAAANSGGLEVGGG